MRKPMRSPAQSTAIRPVPAPRRVRPIAAVAAALTILLAAVPVRARMRTPQSLGAMVASAARIFRGRCTGAHVEHVEIAGARVPVTTYTFRVGEHLKGGAATRVTFRQLGAPRGGPRDLGQLVGLPAYTPGSEYVLFLLPPSRDGMTSPAGAGDGAFALSGERLRSAHGDTASAPAASAAATAASRAGASGAMPTSYEELRRAVGDELRR